MYVCWLIVQIAPKECWSRWCARLTTFGIFELRPNVIRLVWLSIFCLCCNQFGTLPCVQFFYHAMFLVPRAIIMCAVLLNACFLVKSHYCCTEPAWLHQAWLSVSPISASAGLDGAA